MSEWKRGLASALAAAAVACFKCHSGAPRESVWSEVRK